MNPKKATEYSIGLDLGTASVGWALVDQNGAVCHIKNRPTLGSRLFPSADPAAGTRAFRSQRRRIARRRQRIEKLQEIFAPAMAEVDPNFFIRMNQSALVPEDRDGIKWTLFNNEEEEKDFYKKFPTVFHLRKYLMENHDKADLRWVYLALHNIMKCRGNFLHEGEKISAKTANPNKSIENLAKSLGAYYQTLVDEGAPADEADEFRADPDIDELVKVLTEPNQRRSDKANDFSKALRPANKAWTKKLARACVGLKVEFSDLFYGMEAQEGSKFLLSDDVAPDAFENICPDDGRALYDAIRSVYSAYVLHEIVEGQDSLSSAMVASYEQHKAELECLKRLLRDDRYFLRQGNHHKEYNQFFRGPKDSNGDYDINRLPKGSYTAYIAGELLANKKGCNHEAMIKTLKSILDGAASDKWKEEGSEDPWSPQQHDSMSYAQMWQLLDNDEENFLGKQKTSDNGAIPNQLHAEELERIIDNQSAFYPFLAENKDLLRKILTSRIPYYVGPLNTQPDPNGPFPDNQDPTRKFGWSVRKAGMENVKAYPWNIDEVFDKDATAEKFIRRMLGTCSYLYGEEVLPRHSLLYEKFCVLNELNGAKVRMGGSSEFKRFGHDLKHQVFENVFKRHKTVSYKRLQRYLAENLQGGANSQIKGAQGEAGFVSKLEAWNDFCRILNVDDLESDECPLTVDQIEKIILWSTIFEDKSIYKRKLDELNAELENPLSDDQLAKLLRLRYEGWGNLSRKLLEGIYTGQTNDRVEKRPGWKANAHTIIDILENGNPLPGKHNESMLFMEIVHDKDFGFEKTIEQINKERFADGNKISIEDLPGSPALRRTVNQAMLVVDELVKVAGKRSPKTICIEVTRDDDLNRRGRRTTRRYDRILECYKTLKQDAEEFDPAVLSELKNNKESLNSGGSERLALYFLQNGKSLYSGKPLDIRRLNDYQVDHILPQMFIKDDSLDNKALVLQKENQKKLDDKMIDPAIQSKMRRTWEALHNAKLISDKKFSNLTRKSVADRQLIGFVNRQLVETSQVVKFVRLLCGQKYPETRVVSVRASISSGVRERAGLYKSRSLNDFHHAHDAFLACMDVRFLDTMLPKWADGINITRIREWLKQQGKDDPKHPYGRSGVIVDRMCNTNLKPNPVTGEIWDAAAELDRMRRVVQYKGVFLSRMTEYQTGAFWDQTVYSPKDKKNSKPDKHGVVHLMPLKGAETGTPLDVKKYGGYNKPSQAYFFAFEAIDKKGKKKCFFEGVPCYLASSLASDPSALQRYAESIAKENGCHDPLILRRCVPLRQKFILNGDAFFLGGRSNKTNVARNADEISGNLPQTKLIAAIDKGNGKEIDKEDLVKLILWVVKEFKLINRRGSGSLQLDSEEAFQKLSDLSVTDLGKLIHTLLDYSRGASQSCDLSSLGRSSQSCFILLTLGSLLPEIIWIDQSVTGIFERQSTFDDLETEARKRQQ